METIQLPMKSKLSEVALDTPLEDLESDLVAVRNAVYQLRTHEALLELAIRMRQERDGAARATTKVAASGVPSAGEFGRHPTVTGRPGSLREAILWVLNEATQPWSAAKIFEALEAKGWQPTNENAKSQVAARLSKLVKRGEILRLGRGQYVLPTTENVVAASKLGIGDAE